MTGLGDHRVCYHQRQRICTGYCDSHSRICHELKRETEVGSLCSLQESTAISIYPTLPALPGIPWYCQMPV
jgi:hypothetical protein